MFDTTNMEIAPAETEEQKTKRKNLKRWQNQMSIKLIYDRD